MAPLPRFCSSRDDARASSRDEQNGRGTECHSSSALFGRHVCRRGASTTCCWAARARDLRAGAETSVSMLARSIGCGVQPTGSVTRSCPPARGAPPAPATSCRSRSWMRAETPRSATNRLPGGGACRACSDGRCSSSRRHGPIARGETRRSSTGPRLPEQWVTTLPAASPWCGRSSASSSSAPRCIRNVPLGRSTTRGGSGCCPARSLERFLGRSAERGRNGVTRASRTARAPAARRLRPAGVEPRAPDDRGARTGRRSACGDRSIPATTRTGSGASISATSSTRSSSRSRARSTTRRCSTCMRTNGDGSPWSGRATWSSRSPTWRSGPRRRSCRPVCGPRSVLFGVG